MAAAQRAEQSMAARPAVRNLTRPDVERSASYVLRSGAVIFEAERR